MSKPFSLKHVKSYEAAGKVYHYHRITKERLPDELGKRAARVREINEELGLSLVRGKKRSIERLRRDETALLGDIQDLEKTEHDLQQRIKSAKAQKRRLNRGTERPNACWSWEPPMAAPKRLRGVYRLIKDGRTVYIGQSVNILSRVANHAATKDFDEFSYALVDGGREALNEIESALIILERPPENKKPPVGHKWTREEAQAVLDNYRSRARSAA